MDIFETNKLFLFLVFVIPGFVSLKTYSLFYLDVPKDSSQLLIDAITYSSVNYAILLVPIYSIEVNHIRSLYPWVYFIFYFFVFFVAPISWACLLWKLRNSKFFQKTIPHPVGKAWDYVFGLREPYWLIITLKNEKKIAGRYDSKSFASSSPEPEQIYLQEAWLVNEDGGFERSRENTAGIMVLGSEIETIEFFNIIEGDLECLKESKIARAASLKRGAINLLRKKRKSLIKVISQNLMKTNRLNHHQRSLKMGHRV